MRCLSIVATIVCGGSVFGSCFVSQYFGPSSFAIILMGTRKLVALLNCLPGVL